MGFKDNGTWSIKYYLNQDYLQNILVDTQKTKLTVLSHTHTQRTVLQQENQYLSLTHVALERLVLQSRQIIRDPDAWPWSQPKRVHYYRVPSLATWGFTNLHVLNREHSMHIQFVQNLEEDVYKRKRSRKPVSLATPACGHRYHQRWVHAPTGCPSLTLTSTHLTLERGSPPGVSVRGQLPIATANLKWSNPRIQCYDKIIFKNTSLHYFCR